MFSACLLISWVSPNWSSKEPDWLGLGPPQPRPFLLPCPTHAVPTSPGPTRPAANPHSPLKVFLNSSSSYLLTTTLRAVGIIPISHAWKLRVKCRQPSRKRQTWALFSQQERSSEKAAVTFLLLLQRTVQCSAQGCLVNGFELDLSLIVDW